MTTPEQIALSLDAGSSVVFQRVPPNLDAGTLAEALQGTVVKDPFEDANPPRVLDARRHRSFAGLDPDRARLSDLADRSPLVVMLDHASADALARDAPHTLSWAGGVWLPPDHPAFGAYTDEQVEEGERALKMAIEREPSFARAHAGELVAVDILSGRLFARVGTATAFDVAREHIDDGIIYEALLPR